MEVTETIKLVHETDVVCDHLKHIKKLLVTNREPPELYIHLNQCAKLLLETLEANFKIYFEWSL